MMGVMIKVPAVGESITEATISEWFKKEGDAVVEGEPLCSMETDKVTVDVPAPTSGFLGTILATAGQVVAIGDTIGTVESQPTAAGVSTQPGATAQTPKVAAPPAEPAGQPTPVPVSTEAPAPTIAQQPAKITPAAQHLLAVSHIDVADVSATGPRGHVLKEDVQRAISAATPPVQPAPSAHLTPPPQAPPVSPIPPTPPQPPTAVSSTGRDEERVAMTPLRRRIAQRLVSAQHTAAILTTFNEVDMTAVFAARDKYQDTFVKKHGTKLGFMSFFIKASIDALKTFPAVNAEIDGEVIVYKNYYDISVAVGGGKGLVVPVLRDADRLSFAEIELKLAELADKAKNNKLSLDELQGGTFTLSNGGIYGSLLSTPILNPPQSGILGMHKIEKRAVVIDDHIVIRPMMYLAFSYDHRLIDGREAVSFLVRIKDCIEAPERMLFEV